MRKSRPGTNLTCWREHRERGEELCDCVRAVGENGCLLLLVHMMIIYLLYWIKLHLEYFALPELEINSLEPFRILILHRSHRSFEINLSRCSVNTQIVHFISLMR